MQQAGVPRKILPIQPILSTENDNHMDLYAEALPTNPVEGGPYPEEGSLNDLDMNRNPKGMPRLLYPCTEDYLESVGRYMKRYTSPGRLIPGVTGPNYKRPGRTPGKKEIPNGIPTQTVSRQAQTKTGIRQSLRFSLACTYLYNKRHYVQCGYDHVAMGNLEKVKKQYGAASTRRQVLYML